MAGIFCCVIEIQW